MMSSALPSEISDNTVAEAARALIGKSADEILALSGGGNNRAFRVRHGDDFYFLKNYPVAGDDPRDRLGVEFQALRFLEFQGVDAVPRPVAMDRETGFALYQWIDGHKIDAVDFKEITAVLAFINTLNNLTGSVSADSLVAASEACLSGEELVRQIRARQTRLSEIALSGGQPELRDFLETKFSPALDTLEATARSAYNDCGVGFITDISLDTRILNPSDFGFHNALRTDDGRIVFVDFEYFGWDDPVKMVSDFLLHPGHTLSLDARRHFRQATLEMFSKDAFFENRLRALYPLYGLRWCLIILAEFLPERMARRQLAGKHSDPETTQRTQLQKSKDMLEHLMATHGAS